MDVLRAELERRRTETERLKRKAGVHVAAKKGRKRFVRRGELERARKAEVVKRQAKEEEEDVVRKLKAAGAVDERGRPVMTVDAPGGASKSKSKTSSSTTDAEAGAGAGAGAGAASPVASRKRGRMDGSPAPASPAVGSPAVALPKATVILRLRALGEPVTLFGESDTQRLARLRTAEGRRMETAEDDDMRLAKGHDIDNIFLEQSRRKRRTELNAMRKEANGDGNPRSRKKAKKTHSDKTDEERAAEKREKAKKSPALYCRWFLKRLLRMWEEEMAARPESVTRTAQGKYQSTVLKQAKDYLRPFFRMCKRGEIPPNILKHVHKIVKYCEQREYVKANDEYVLVAIGNAPWPMGVTSIGIHERAARTKIFADRVAHVMNDEQQRKYLTCIKRLMTFCQRRYPADPSKMVQ